MWTVISQIMFAFLMSAISVAILYVLAKVIEKTARKVMNKLGWE